MLHGAIHALALLPDIGGGGGKDCQSQHENIPIKLVFLGRNLAATVPVAKLEDCARIHEIWLSCATTTKTVEQRRRRTNWKKKMAVGHSSMAHTLIGKTPAAAAKFCHTHTHFNFFFKINFIKQFIRILSLIYVHFVGHLINKLVLTYSARGRKDLAQKMAQIYTLFSSL